ncbi:MAG: hypothetical protein WD294_01655 [Phycisphaeraceae bacterium]
MRILIGVIILVAIALLGASRHLWAVRRTRWGAVLLTGGWVMIGIGLLIGPRGVGLLEPNELMVIQPLILFCLAWIGLMVGLQADRRLPSMLPAGTTSLAVKDGLLSLAVIGATAAGAMWLLVPTVSWWAVGVQATILGACAMGWSAEVRSLRRVETNDQPLLALLRGAAGVSTIFAVCVYGLAVKLTEQALTATDVVPMLGMGLATSVLIAVTMGLLGLWLIGVAGRSEPEFLVVLLGLVSFTAGAAAALGYAPMFVALLTGVVIVNMPGQSMQKFQKVIIEAEQPIAMALMLVAGILAEPMLGATGWAVVAAVISVRMLLKLGWASRQLRRATPGQTRFVPGMLGPLRQTPLAIALATGYAATGQTMPGEFINGGQLLMIVILVGLFSDIAAMLGQYRRRAAEERADPEGSP